MKKELQRRSPDLAGAGNGWKRRASPEPLFRHSLSSYSSSGAGCLPPDLLRRRPHTSMDRPASCLHSLLGDTIVSHQKQEELKKERELHGILRPSPLKHDTVKWLRKRGYRVPQPPTTKENKMQIDFYHSLFNIFDEDGSGEVDAEELRSALEIVKVQRDQVDSFLGLADANKSGSIDFQEFLEAVEKLEEAQEKATAAGECGDAIIPWSLVAINYDSKKLLQEWGLPIREKQGHGESRRKLQAIVTVMKVLRQLAKDKETLQSSITQPSFVPPLSSVSFLARSESTPSPELTADDLEKISLVGKKKSHSEESVRVPPSTPVSRKDCDKDHKSEHRAKAIARRGRMMISPFSLARRLDSHKGKIRTSPRKTKDELLNRRRREVPSPLKDVGDCGLQSGARARSPPMSLARFQTLYKQTMRSNSPILASVASDDQLSLVSSDLSFRKDFDSLKKHRKERLQKAHGDCRMGADMFRSMTKPSVVPLNLEAAGKFSDVKSPLRSYIRGSDTEKVRTQGIPIEGSHGAGPGAMDFMGTQIQQTSTPQSRPGALHSAAKSTCEQLDDADISVPEVGVVDATASSKVYAAASPIMSPTLKQIEGKTRDKEISQHQSKHKQNRTRHSRSTEQTHWTRSNTPMTSLSFIV